MITYTQGNLLEADTEVLVNTVNTVGVMGKGIALMFKERYPQNMQAYAHACKQQEVNVGKMFVVPTEELLGAKWIVNFPTKQHWRNPSKMEWVESGLQDLQRFIIENNIQSIAIPPLGAGNGGLRWSDVKLRIEHYLSSLSDVNIVVYEPTAAYQNSKKTTGVTKLTPARALVLELVRQYLSVGMDCSEVEVQKMVYFLTRIIQTKNMKDPLNLNFKANKYGLYASNLTHLLDSLDGYYISAEKRIADSHASEPIIRFNYQYQDELQQYLQTNQTEFMPALSETLQMIEMFESPFGMELLATVDWLVSKKEVEPSLNAVKENLQHWFSASRDNQWQQRKSHMLNDKAIVTALERLRGFSYEPSVLTH